MRRTLFHKLFFILCAVFLAPALRADLPPVMIKNGRLSAGGKDLRLRGINWGWWQIGGTRYTEADMKQQSEWGANVLRLPFTYTDVIDRDGGWNENNFARLDEVVQWAKKYGQYVILDLHVAPGGQNQTAYTDGGHNLLWSDENRQRHYLSLWRELAKRYRNTPNVAAYELLNEPKTGRPEPELLTRLNRLAVAEIRKIDPDKVIVVSGDKMGNAQDLEAPILIDDPNILYTFHFYEGAITGPWRRNAEGEKLSGTSGWTRYELSLTIPADIATVRPLLRSTGNRGSAWFDDVEFSDGSGKVLHRFTFNKGPEQFSVERAPHGDGMFDPASGHSAPGCLRVSGTTDYNGWSGPGWPVEPGRTYKLSGWIKLKNATGATCLALSLFGSAQLGSEVLENHLKPAVDFARRYRVPVWVGEFGIVRGTGPAGLQADAVAERIRLFEKYGFHWTYWNFHETAGPHGMALQSQKRDGGEHPVNATLLQELRKGWRRNRP